MGLGIAIGGGVIMAVMVTVIITVMMLIPQGAIVQESMHDSFQLSNKYEKTSFAFDSTSAESGLSAFSFVLENTGLEKLWNYDDSNVFVTYDALIDGVRTSVTETPSYYSSSNISIDCDGTTSGEIPSGNWTISQIIGDGIDPGLINSHEKAEIVTKLNYPLYNETSTISLTFASDVGQTQTISFDTDASECAWYSPNWASRELIRINHDQVTGNLTNFPVMISLTDSDYKGVYHFNENVNDSTHNYNGTDSGSSDTSGQIDRARDFQSPDRINFASSAWMSGYLDKITMQAWVNPDSISGYDTIVGFGTDGDYPTLSLKDGKISYWSSTTSPRELLSSDTLSTGTWSFVTVTYDGVTDQAKIYLNDNNDGMDSMSGSTYTGTNRWIGNDDNGEPFDGQLDEVRILDIVLSKNWIITEYNNQNSPNTFYSIGTAEALGS